LSKKIAVKIKVISNIGEKGREGEKEKFDNSVLAIIPMQSMQF
jgi:hypothetical protein